MIWKYKKSFNFLFLSNTKTIKNVFIHLNKAEIKYNIR